MNKVYMHQIAALNTCQAGAQPTPQTLDFAPSLRALPLPNPVLDGAIFNRKTARVLDAQGLRLLASTAPLAHTMQALGISPERMALCAAIPEVDAPSPCWEAVEAMTLQPADPLSALLGNTPPLHALSLLNSTVLSLVAEALQCQGPMAGFCSQESAGIDALFEAAQLIAEGHADAALVVSTSPNLTPAIYLRGDAALGEVLGEGAASALLTREPAANTPQWVRIDGMARAFLPPGADPHRVIQQLLDNALAPSQLCLSDVQQILLRNIDPLALPALARRDNVCQADNAPGRLGAATLLTDIAGALEHLPAHVECDPLNLLLLIQSRSGHLGAVLFCVGKTEPS